MRRLFVGASLALCLASAGCNLFTTGVNNLCYETRLNVAEHYDDCRYVALAQEAWASAREKCGANGESPDFAHGFKDGFADYMKFGGNGEPPALPPKHYQGVHYQTPKGYKLIEAWYAGFREGAAAARVSGLRQYELLPIKGLVGGPGHPTVPGSPILLPPVPSALAFPPDTGPAPEIAPYPTPVETTPASPRIEPKQAEPISAPPEELKQPKPPAFDLLPPVAPQLPERLNLLPPTPPVPAAPEPAVPAPPSTLPALPPPPTVPMTRRPAEPIAPPRLIDEHVTAASALEIRVPIVPAPPSTLPALSPPPTVPMTRRPVERIAPPRIIDGNATPASAVTIIEGPGGPNDPPPQPGTPVPPRFGVPGSSPPVRIIEGDGVGSRP